MEARSGEAQSAGVTIRMIGFDGRLQWRRHGLFKLHAMLPQCKKGMNYRGLVVWPRSNPKRNPHPKFAIRSFLGRRTRNEQAAYLSLFQAASGSAIIGFGAVPTPGFSRKSYVIKCQGPVAGLPSSICESVRFSILQNR